MAFWNKKDKKEEPDWEGFSEGKRNFEPLPKPTVPDQPPKDRHKAFAADKKGYDKAQSKLQRSSEKLHQRQMSGDIKVDKGAMRDINRELLAADIAGENKGSFKKKAPKPSTEGINFEEDFAKEKKTKESFKEFAKSDALNFLDDKEDNVVRYKNVEKTDPETGETIFEQQRVDKKGKVLKKKKDKTNNLFTGKTVNPMAGLSGSSSKGSKRGPGRPRKYARQRPSGRGPGRPRERNITLGSMEMYEDERSFEQPQRPYVPPTEEQQFFLSMFGRKQQFWGFGGNPIRINKKLSSGQGLIKTGDNGATASMFGMRRRR